MGRDALEFFCDDDINFGRAAETGFYPTDEVIYCHWCKEEITRTDEIACDGLCLDCWSRKSLDILE